MPTKIIHPDGKEEWVTMTQVFWCDQHREVLASYICVDRDPNAWKKPESEVTDGRGRTTTNN